MSDITPIGRSTITGLTTSGRTTSVATPSTVADRGGDKVELSTAAQLYNKLNQLPPVRQDLVNRVKNEIAQGGYDSDDKIDALLPSLSEDLGLSA